MNNSLLFIEFPKDIKICIFMKITYNELISLVDKTAVYILSCEGWFKSLIGRLVLDNV